jgi:hypothetical protein
MNKLLQKVYGMKPSNVEEEKEESENKNKYNKYDNTNQKSQTIDVGLFDRFVLTEKRMMDSLQPIMRSDNKKYVVSPPIEKQEKVCPFFSIAKKIQSTEKKLVIEMDSNKDFFFPREKDGLFWCFFIMKYGKDVYKDLGKTNIVIERKWKIDYIEILRNNKQLLKNNKMAPLTHIENFLLNEEKIDIKTFLALCLVENLHVMHIHKNTYHEIGEEDEDKGENIILTGTGAYDVESEVSSYILMRLDKPLKYGYKKVTNTLELSNIKEKYYKIHNMLKPLKGMSSYKVDELIEFCKKLEITIMTMKMNKKTCLESTKTKSKKELYEDLIKYFS